MRGLIPNARKLHKFFLGFRDRAAKFFLNHFRRTNNCFRFVAEERHRGNFFRERCRRGPSEVESCFILLEKSRSELIHRFVSALRREDDRDDTLERRLMHQLALRDRIRPFQIRNNLLRTQSTLITTHRSSGVCSSCGKAKWKKSWRSAPAEKTVQSVTARGPMAGRSAMNESINIPKTPSRHSTVSR